jgi:hypothetical protein
MSAYTSTPINRDQIFIPSPVSVTRTVQLSRLISAVHLEPAAESGRARLGEIRSLPVGATLEICGDGYNEKTIKIRCDKEFFFVFQTDLNPDPLH